MNNPSTSSDKNEMTLFPNNTFEETIPRVIEQ